MNRTLEQNQQIATQKTNQDDIGLVSDLIHKAINDSGIITKINQKNSCLYLLFESEPYPPKYEQLELLIQKINDLQLTSVNVIKIGGRVKGQKKVAWQHKLVFNSGKSALDLSSWLDSGVSFPSLPRKVKQEYTHLHQEKFLCFAIGSNHRALLSVTSLKEVLQISLEDILSIPHMNTYILGIYNWRGEILWLIDLNHLLGFQAINQSPNPENHGMAIIVEVDNQILGLLVPQVEEIEHHDLDSLQPTGELINSPLKQFVRGYLPTNNNLILDIEEIVQASKLQ